MYLFLDVRVINKLWRVKKYGPLHKENPFICRQIWHAFF